ncbi:MAG: hypothetical protein RL177_1506 [Bacteroidota bacterium]
MVLGLNFAGRDLLYAVSAGGKVTTLHHIGRIVLNVDATQALGRPGSEDLRVVSAAVRDLVVKHGIKRIRLIVPAELETWATVPKLVYDHPDEREAYLSILHHGVDRAELAPTWHELSNRDYKLLGVRAKSTLAGYREIGDLAPEYDLCSEFEAGLEWISAQSNPGSVLLIGCHESVLTVSSFTLGSLRAATWFRFEDPSDLRYLWPHTAASAKWMSGVHERILLYGANAWQNADLLHAFHESSIPFLRLDSLSLIGVAAEEQTYGFGLDEAFPAIMMAIN